FAITGGNAANGLDLSGILIVKEARAKNMIGRHDSFERRLDHFLGRVRYDVKRKAMAFDQVFDKTREQVNILLQTNPLADFDQMLFANRAIFRIMEQQISQFSALL